MAGPAQRPTSPGSHSRLPGHVLARGLALIVTLMVTVAAVRADTLKCDVVVVGGTPGGIMAAIAAARAGRSVMLLERGEHIGGLPANGLGATDIGTRGATGGLFLEFVRLVRRHYADVYGPESEQVRDCSDGYHFEPHVAEQVFEAMLAGQKDRLRVARRRQFDAEPANVTIVEGVVTGLTVRDLASGTTEFYEAKAFIDATYEGDLAAAAGARIAWDGRGATSTVRRWPGGSTRSGVDRLALGLPARPTTPSRRSTTACA